MRKTKLSVKLQIVLNLLFVVVMALQVLAVYRTARTETVKRSKEELVNNSMLIYELTSLYVSSSVQNRLRAIAEKANSYISLEYKRVEKGDISEEEALSKVSELLLDPVYGKIGTTGYLAGVNTKGILTIHPKSQGADASGYDFMQEAITRKNGYIEYEWQNKDETEARMKAGYMSYFSPWDIIVWASSYKDEFNYLLNTDSLKHTLEQLKIGETGYAFILDKEGRAIFHPELTGEEVLNKTSAKGKLKELNDLVEMSVSQPGVMVQGEYIGESDQELRTVSVVYFDTLGWYIISSSTNKEILSMVSRIGRIMLVALVLAFVAMNAVIFFLFKLLLKPLDDVRSVITSISTGNLYHNIEVKSMDEIGEIAGDINQLTGGLRDVFVRMKTDVETIDYSIQDLSSSSQEISTTSNEQASAVREIVSTMEDSDVLTKSIDRMTSIVAEISNTIREMIVSGVSNVEESLIKMDEIRRSNDDTIAGIRSLSEKIEAIWEIVTIINSIADQTKIIAFNAELEASAAGEAGKNFQIVASEIRRLADSTVSSTSEIKSKINEIQHSSDRLITASEDGTNKIKEGGQLTETLHQTFEAIRDTSEESTRSANEISESVKQQVEATEQILLTLKQISEGINNFVISTKSTTEISHKLKEMSDRMSEFLGFYKLDQ